MKQRLKNVLGFLLILVFSLTILRQVVQADIITVVVTIERIVAGMVFAPSDQNGVPGQTLVYIFHIQNTGNSSDTFDLSTLSSNGWTTNLPAGNTVGPLAPGRDSVPVDVELSIPAEAEPGTQDILTLTATSQYDSNVSESASVTTSVSYPSNNPPVLNPIGDKIVDEGKMLSFRITASDSDKDKLFFTIINEPQGVRFSQSRNRAYFRWRPAYEQAGIYKVTFVVTDDGEPRLTDFETITITVNDVEKKK